MLVLVVGVAVGMVYGIGVVDLRRGMVVGNRRRLPGKDMMGLHRWEVDRRRCRSVVDRRRFEEVVGCMVGSPVLRRWDDHIAVLLIEPLRSRVVIHSRGGL